MDYLYLILLGDRIFAMSLAMLILSLALGMSTLWNNQSGAILDAWKVARWFLLASLVFALIIIFVPSARQTASLLQAQTEIGVKLSPEVQKQVKVYLEGCCAESRETLEKGE